MIHAIEFLEEKARNIRYSIIKQIECAQSGHPGGSLSAVEILTALYFEIMNIDPKDPRNANRDRFVLSKGHAAPLLYAVLAERGFFSKEELPSFRKINSKLQGHPDMKNIKGVDMSTGSLGQGFSAAHGMALAGKLDHKEYHVFTLLGDGELEEGLIWETAMAAGHYKTDNLIAIIDHNQLQIDGYIKEVLNPEPIKDKFKAFGWHVIELEDGHNIEKIVDTLHRAKEYQGKPIVIIAETIKGKGISYMENQCGWHGKAPNKEEAKKAYEELGGIK